MHETASSDHVPKEDMKYTQDNLAECEAKASYYLIQVHLKGGKDLVIRDSSGTSDPYVKFKYKNKTIYKSSIIFKNLNPQWNERFAYTVDDLSLGLTLNVYDYDRFGSDDYMGSADLNISEIPLNRPTDLELMLGQSKSQEYMGYLIIQVTIATVTEKDCNQLTRKRISPETSAIAKKTKLVTTHSWTSVVNIVLVEAKNLHDVSSWSLLPDAYVKFRLGPEKYKSKVISKCSHPKWLEQFDMHGYDDQRFLLEVLVCDKRRNLEIGRCLINLSDLERETTHHEWYDLNQGSRGQIFLLISISGMANSHGNAAILFDDSSLEETRSIADNHLLLQQYSFLKTHENISDVGHLVVRVIKAQGLAAADIGGKSDPFCVLELVNARVQTHTDYKTLSPQWNKTFSFAIKDINSVLDITVFDEDANKRMEFLGRIVIPLLKVPQNDKKWYALKDKKLERRAKGKILLEFDIVWNPVRAALRTISPKEQKYILHEEKFKRQIFIRNALRIKSLIMEIVGVWWFCQKCWAWESPTRSFFAFLIFIISTYFAELYMLPLVLLALFLKGYIFRSWAESTRLRTCNLEEFAESDSEEESNMNDDKEEKIGFKQRLIAIQDTLTMVQNALDYISSTMERVKNTFNFTEPFLSFLAIIILCIAAIILYIFPLRWIIMLWGINKFTKRLRKPNSVPNNELLDFLSRVPSDDEIRKYAEFRLDQGSSGTSFITSSTKNRKKDAN